MNNVGKKDSSALESNDDTETDEKISSSQAHHCEVCKKTFYKRYQLKYELFIRIFISLWTLIAA
jgi:hypothetical protein